MPPFPLYEGKVALSTVVFYLFYRFLLRKETFHRLNRAVLVGSALLSFVLPLCTITVRRPLEMAPPGVLSRLGDGSSSGIGETLHDVFAAAWLQGAVGVVFWVGVAAVLLRIGISILSTLRIIAGGEVVRKEGALRIIVTERDIDPFSWMRYIVLSRRDWERANAPILAHEKAHICRGHSVELLIVDIMAAFQWFNPAIWMLRQDLCDIHEYEADEAVLRSGVPLREYRYLLLAKAAPLSAYSVVNSFSHSVLRNRITMMSKTKSPSSRGWRLLYVLPAVCLGLGLQAKTVYVPTQSVSHALPSAEGPHEPRLPEIPVLNLSADATVEMNGRTVPISRVGELFAHSGSSTVRIVADPDLRMGVVYDLKTELRKIGVLKIIYAFPADNASGYPLPPSTPSTSASSS